MKIEDMKMTTPTINELVRRDDVHKTDAAIDVLLDAMNEHRKSGDNHGLLRVINAPSLANKKLSA